MLATETAESRRQADTRERVFHSVRAIETTNYIIRMLLSLVGCAAGRRMFDFNTNFTLPGYMCSPREPAQCWGTLVTIVGIGMVQAVCCSSIKLNSRGRR